MKGCDGLIQYVFGIIQKNIEFKPVDKTLETLEALAGVVIASLAALATAAPG